MDENILFATKSFTWSSYIVTKTLPTARQIKLINKEKFIKAILDENNETLVIHVAAFKAPEQAI